MENHLEMGKKLLAAGQLADALSHFHAAVGQCPSTTTIQGHSDQLTALIKCFLLNVLTLNVLNWIYHLSVSRWRSPKLHGLLQESYSFPGHGQV